MSKKSKRIKELIDDIKGHSPLSHTPQNSDFAILELGRLAAEPDGFPVLHALSKTFEEAKDEDNKIVCRATLEAIHQAACCNATLSPILDLLVEQFDSGNREFALVASLTRAHFNSQSSKQVRELLLHEDDEVRHIAREAVREASVDGRQIEFLLPTLLQLLRSSDSAAALLAATVLLHGARGGQDMDRALVPLVRAVARRDKRIAARAAAALTYLKGHNVSLKPYISTIVNMLSGWSQETEKTVVIEALRRYCAKGKNEAQQVLKAMKLVSGLERRAQTRDFMRELEIRVAGKGTARRR